MDVILLQRIEKLGQMGEVVKVKPGFARNYLLPQKKALRATDANRARFEKQRAQLEAINLTRRQEAEKISGKVDGLTVVIIRQAGETGHLYGSDSPIKMLGLHPVRVALHPEVIVTITANVAKSEEEAEIQKKAGGFVPPTTEEEPSLEEVLAEADQAAAGEAEPAEAEAPAAEEAKPKKKAKAEKEPKAEKADKPAKKSKSKKAADEDEE